MSDRRATGPLPVTITHVATLADDWTVLRRYDVRRRGAAATLHRREVVHRGDTVMVLLHSLARRSVLLITELRLPVMLAGVGDRFLEAPGGLLDPDETPEQAARREVREESGFSLGPLSPAGCYFPAPALSTEQCHCFMANVDGLVRAPEAVDDSDMLGMPDLVELPLADAVARCGSGIRDARTALLIHAFSSALKDMDQ